MADNGWAAASPGIAVITWSPSPAAPCDLIPRDANTVVIDGNDSSPTVSGLTVGPTKQAYGVGFGAYAVGWSTNKLNYVNVNQDNFAGAYPLSLFGALNTVFLDGLVGLYNYLGVQYTNTPLNSGVSPITLPVDVTSADLTTPPYGLLWPVPPRCPEVLTAKVAAPPVGTKLGSPRGTFRFSVSHPGGANQIKATWGVLSVGGADADGSPGPSGTSCSFTYDTINNGISLQDRDGSWLPSSTVGSGSDLSTSDPNPQDRCTIHVASSTSSLTAPQPPVVPRVYVLDLILDLSLPTSQSNKYHIYTWAEDQNNHLTPSQYSGYWWNIN